VGALVLEYYLLLREVLRAKPSLRACRTRCRHCRIFFLTHPRNAGRCDLGCPFGCQQAHRKEQSGRRSIEYYRGKEGQIKKRIQNGRRRAAGRPTDPPKVRSGESGGWPEPMLEHVRMVSSLIEGRRVSRREVLEMLERVLRQHSICRRPKIDQTVAWLNEHPP
jgi:hypothetical protein